MRLFTHRPNKKQFIALQLLYDFVTTYILFGGGAGGGKSWLGCEWMLAMCLNYPGVRYFMAREELKKLKETTLKTFFKVAKVHGVSGTFRFYDHYSSIRFSNGSEISLLELKDIPSDPMFERFGSLEFTGGMIDEAGEVAFGAFDTLKARVGRHLNQELNIPRKILLTCNPKKNWLYHTFYKPWLEKMLETGYAFIQALVSENDKIDDGYEKGLDEIKDPVLKARLKYGEWDYEDDPAALTDFEKIISIFTNEYVPAGPDRYITADIARFGVDKTLIRVWYGLRVVERIERSGLKITESAALIRQTATKHRISMMNTLVDEDGIGGGVVDILNCKGFQANSRPLFDENYDMLKSQCGYKLAELINDGLIYENCPDTKARELITEELQQLKQKSMDNDKKKGLMPKEKIVDLIGHSPNDLDTFIMRALFALKKPATTQMRFQRKTAA